MNHLYIACRPCLENLEISFDDSVSTIAVETARPGLFTAVGIPSSLDIFFLKHHLHGGDQQFMLISEDMMEPIAHTAPRQQLLDHLGIAPKD